MIFWFWGLCERRELCRRRWAAPWKIRLYKTSLKSNDLTNKEMKKNWIECLVLSEYKKQVVFYHKKRVFYYKKQKNNNPKSCFFVFFFVFLYFFYVQSNVLSCFLHSLWLITWKQLLTVPLTHYVTAGRWIEVLWN